LEAAPVRKIKPGIRLNYLQVAIGIGIIFVLMIVFLFIRSSRIKKIINHDQEKTDSARIVKVLPAAPDTSRKQLPALPPAPLPVAKDSVRETAHADSKTISVKKTDHPHPHQVINGAQKYVLELTTSQTCTIKMNGVDIGTLETGKTMKVYLKPGKYLLLATSTSDPSAVYTGNLQVDQENINEVGKLKIRL
jgi:hypothetical protein